MKKYMSYHGFRAKGPDVEVKRRLEDGKNVLEIRTGGEPIRVEFGRTEVKISHLGADLWLGFASEPEIIVDEKGEDVVEGFTARVRDLALVARVDFRGGGALFAKLHPHAVELRFGAGNEVDIYLSPVDADDLSEARERLLRLLIRRLERRSK